MLHKSFALAETKADGDSGRFTATVSTFNGIDSVGDRILPGAYKDTIASLEASGDPLPIILAHQWADVMAHVGYAHADDIRETEKGLEVTGTLDIGDNPVAKQVHKLLKERRLKEFSIGYRVPAGGETKADDGVNEISRIELFECGPCLKGVDPRTELHAVKAALAEQEPRSEDELKRASDAIRRDRVRAEIPATKSDPAPNPVEVLQASVAAAQERADVIEQQFAVLKESMVERPSEDDLRRQSDQVKRDLVREEIPAVPPSAAAPDPLLEAVRGLADRMDALGERFDAQRKEFEQHKASVDMAKDPVGDRAEDLLRKRSLQTVLDIQSDGVSTRKPPKVKAGPIVEIDEADLRKRSREQMLALLTGVEK